MNVYQILDEFEAEVGQCKKSLLQSDKVLIDEQMIYRYIDLIRANFPEDLWEAQWVKKEQQRLMQSAEDEYNKVMEKAEEVANRKVSQSEIVKRAEEVAEEIIYNANMKAHELTEGAFLYASDIMTKLEKQLGIYLDVVHEGREELHKSLQKNMKKER